MTFVSSSTVPHDVKGLPDCSGRKEHFWISVRILNAGGEAKSQADVESGLNESFTSAASKLDGDAAMLSPFLTEDAPEEVPCPPFPLQFRSNLSTA